MSIPLSLGDVVLAQIGGGASSIGIIEYMGYIGKYDFIGLKLTKRTPHGGDGSKNGIRYFRTTMGCGIFVRTHAIVKMLTAGDVFCVLQQQNEELKHVIRELHNQPKRKGNGNVRRQNKANNNQNKAIKILKYSEYTKWNSSCDDMSEYEQESDDSADMHKFYGQTPSSSSSLASDCVPCHNIQKRAKSSPCYGLIQSTQPVLCFHSVSAQ